MALQLPWPWACAACGAGVMVVTFGIMYVRADVPAMEVAKGFVVPRLPEQYIPTVGCHTAAGGRARPPQLPPHARRSWACITACLAWNGWLLHPAHPTPPTSSMHVHPAMPSVVPNSHGALHTGVHVCACLHVNVPACM